MLKNQLFETVESTSVSRGAVSQKISLKWVWVSREILSILSKNRSFDVIRIPIRRSLKIQHGGCGVCMVVPIDSSSMCINSHSLMNVDVGTILHEGIPLL